MILTKKAVKKHHGYLKHSPFYLNLQKELLDHYRTFYDPQSPFAAEEAIKQAIAFTYHDDIPIMCASEPTRIYVVMGLARFLINKGCPPSFLREEIRQDLEAILAQKKIRKYRRYFCKEDREALARDKVYVTNWLAGKPAERPAYFSVQATVNGQKVAVRYTGHNGICKYNGHTIPLPRFRAGDLDFAFGKEQLFVCGWIEGQSFSYHLPVYDFEGHQLWNAGDLVREVCNKQGKFWSLQLLTKEDLADWPWKGRLVHCAIDPEHEYLAAHDGEEYWVFDMTDRTLVKRIYTK